MDEILNDYPVILGEQRRKKKKEKQELAARVLNELNSQLSFWVFMWRNIKDLGIIMAILDLKQFPCFAVLSSTDPAHAQHLSLHL